MLLVGVVGLFLLLSPRHRAWLVRPEPYLGVVLAAILFTPVIVWNAQHDWASFAFQTTQRAAGMGRWKPQYFLQMLGTQIVVVTPYLLAIALAAWLRGLRGWRAVLVDDRHGLLLVAATVPLVVFSLASLRSMVKPNWLAPAYAPLIVLAVEARLTGAAPRAFRIGLATSAVLLLAAVIAMAWPGARLGAANTWSGWPEAARRIDEIQRDLSAGGKPSFVFSTNYKKSASPAFHQAGHPRTYAQDIYGERALQFDFWPPDGSLAGATGILAIDDRRDQSALPPALASHFESVKLIDSIEAGGGGTRHIDLYECRGYRGHPRAERVADHDSDHYLRRCRCLQRRSGAGCARRRAFFVDVPYCGDVDSDPVDHRPHVQGGLQRAHGGPKDRRRARGHRVGAYVRRRIRPTATSELVRGLARQDPGSVASAGSAAADFGGLHRRHPRDEPSPLRRGHGC